MGDFMADCLENNKIKNIDKIRIGSCVELVSILDSFYFIFKRLDEFIINNSFLFTNQNLESIKLHFSLMYNFLSNDFNIFLNDIDKQELYTKYMLRYY